MKQKSDLASQNVVAERSAVSSTEGLEELEAAHRYTNNEAVKSADVIDGAGYPMWYGHAIRTAFVKGIEWERSRSSNGVFSDAPRKD